MACLCVTKRTYQQAGEQVSTHTHGLHSSPVLVVTCGKDTSHMPIGT
jgi:hypothetical protein